MITYNKTRLGQLTKAAKNRLMRDIDWCLEDWCIYNLAGLNDCWGIYVNSAKELEALKAELTELK